MGLKLHNLVTGFGRLTPVGALLIVLVMFVASATVHGPNGFFAASGGSAGA